MGLTEAMKAKLANVSLGENEVIKSEMANMSKAPNKNSQYESDMELYNNLLAKAGRIAGVKPSEVKYTMDLIAYHESARTMDPTIKQRGKYNIAKGKYEVGGPGRGLYQYQLSKSDTYKQASGAGRTAMNRIDQVLGGSGMGTGNLPSWANKYYTKDDKGNYIHDVDASELTATQQNILFLADKIMDPKVKLADIGNLSKDEWWARYHHKGISSDHSTFKANKRRYDANFNRSY